MSLRLVYAGGPGDLIGTYRYWLHGQDDPSQVSLTYSGQFFDVCREIEATALCIASCHRKDSLEDELVRIVHRPIPLETSRAAILYHLGQFCWLLRFIISAIRYRADAVIFAEGTGHFWLLGMLKWFGIAVIPSLHCAFWPAGFRDRGIVQKIIQKLNGRFWRRKVSATICVSPECERQVRAIAAQTSGPIIQSRAQYRREDFSTIPAADLNGRPLVVMYAGRIERDKGVFELLQIAQMLHKALPAGYSWEICGSGSALNELQSAVDRAGLRETFHLRGKLARDAMTQAFGRSHLLVVPTTRSFAEGLNKVAVESILAGRPLVTSQLSNAIDVLGDAVMEVPPDDLIAYADAIARLATDRVLYDAKRSACHSVSDQFFDRTRGWAAALRSALEFVPGGRSVV